jgi:hypothetical protein
MAVVICSIQLTSLSLFISRDSFLANWAGVLHWSTRFDPHPTARQATFHFRAAQAIIAFKDFDCSNMCH